MPDKQDLKNKLHSKINERRIQSGRQTVVNNNKKLTTNEEIYAVSKAMIMDCQLPYIKRLNIRQKYDVLSKKYKNLKNQYIPIFRSILNDELNMSNIGMLEMMLKVRNNASEDQMNNFLAEKYKLDGDEKSKNDDINSKTAEKEFKDYLKKTPELNNYEEKKDD